MTAAIGSPAELTAARGRVDGVFDSLARIRTDDLGRIGYPADGPSDSREVAVDLALAAARDAGRVELLEQARAEAVEVVLRRYGDALYDPTWMGLNWGRSPGRSSDRAAVAAAVRDAATAAVVEDLVSDAVLDELRGRFDLLVASGTPGPPSGSLAAALTPSSARARWVVGGLAVVGIAGFVLGSPGLLLLPAIVAVAWQARRPTRRGTR
ncbi:MAG: hypothetical protein C0498_02535 [Anaerolinea sp.]|nr:hypothetical protein [Anaerolinea sp.]